MWLPIPMQDRQVHAVNVPNASPGPRSPPQSFVSHAHGTSTAMSLLVRLTHRVAGHTLCTTSPRSHIASNHHTRCIRGQPPTKFASRSHMHPCSPCTAEVPPWTSPWASIPRVSPGPRSPPQGLGPHARGTSTATSLLVRPTHRVAGQTLCTTSLRVHTANNHVNCTRS